MSRRLLGILGAVALLGAVLAVAGTTATPRPAAAATVGPLHTNGNDDRIYDAAGKEVRLVGFNWNGTENGGRADKQKVADGCGVVWRTPADPIGGQPFNYDDAYQRIADLGYNVLRIPISWNNLEPIAPTWSAASGTYVHDWNQTYLDDLRSMVTKAKAAGLMVIVDMHQDYWSPALHRITNWDGSSGYCEGVGMPRWMYPTADGKATTTQNTDFYQSMNWFFRNLHDPLATTTQQTPWQLLSAAWDKLAYEFSPASGFAAADAVVGADVFNEPYFSYVGGSPPAGQSVLQAAGARLKTFYEAIGPAITARNPGWLLFFQDSTGGYNAANPAVRETPTMTAKPAVPGNWVYSAHIYAFSYGTFSDGVVRHDDFGITVANQLLANARAWKVPLYIGEFTNFSVGVDARQMTAATMAQTRLFLDWAKANRVNWTFWAYVNPYWPMAFQNYLTNQPIPVIRDALATGLDSPTDPPDPPDPPGSTYASDTFGRAVTGGLGSAEVGGAWTVGGGATNFAVSGGTARVVASAGGSRTMSLDSFQSTDTKITTRLAFDKAQTGGGSYVAVIGRRVNASNDYRLKLRAQAGGAVTAQVVRVVGGAETVVQTLATVPGLSWGAGQYVKVRFEAQGTSPTALRAKVWADGAAEPTSWTLQTTDSTAGLQAGGGIGLWDYLSSSATNAPVTLLVDDLLATPVAGGTPPANQPPTASFTTSCTDLTCSVDATGSADADGTIASYAWSFGDGQTGSGVTSSRTYAAAGTYTVTLTVTDDDGATASTTRQVGPTAPPPTNQPPTASFTTSCTDLTCSVDATGSADADGTIASYAWSFGDGQTGSGVTSSRTYAAAGTYTVTLTVTDDDGATASTTRQVGPTAPPPTNQPPTASFTTSCTDLTCSVDATGSADADGTIASYAWSFGDGQTGSGVTSSRTYAAAGTYTVTLTVTDDDGATASTTRQVGPTAPPPTGVLGADAFGRTTTGGWGSADVGGPWTTASAATSFGVGGGTGNVSMTAGAGRNVYLAGVLSSSTDVAFTMSLDKAATGGGVYVSPIGRRVVGVGEYRAKVRVLGGGQVALSLVRASSTGAETTIRAEANVAGLTATAGTQLRVRLQVTGTNPTTVRAKVWAAGAAEPAGWTASVTDATSGMQVAGSVGFNTYLSSSTTNAPLTVRFDDLAVTPAA
ncbi:PKD domain-containing protein [Dermatobacter hominis]|uniref:PKD domain-containing protein n=1 Tax=Dermatobacter hominis TaxID=2884263 RepID=UPI001D10166C|nr:PKD domain-containing protein [Dermatobacter hominis]UDY36949.1 PKD domain-containing protein [Dermatobacter hominis]